MERLELAAKRAEWVDLLRFARELGIDGETLAWLLSRPPRIAVLRADLGGREVLVTSAAALLSRIRRGAAHVRLGVDPVRLVDSEVVREAAAEGVLSANVPGVVH